MTWKALPVDLERAVERELDSTAWMERCRKRGEQIAVTFKNLSQVRALESQVVSARTLSSIVAFIERQAGKSGTAKEWADVAPDLIADFDHIRARADALIAGVAVKQDTDADDDTMKVRVRLARGWCAQTVAHCLYRRALSA